MLNATRNRDVVGPVAAEDFGQKSEIFRRIALLKFVADFFPPSPSDHRRLHTHQIAPAELLEDAPAVKIDILVRQPLDDPATPFADGFARLIDAEVVVGLTRR